MFSFGKGMILGLAAGIGMTLAVKPMSKRDLRMIKRRAKQAFSSISDAADSMCCKLK